MAEGLDSLQKSIGDWLSDASKDRAGSTSKRVTTGKLSELKGISDLTERATTAKQMGLDPEVAKKAEDYHKSSIKLNSSITRLMTEQGIQFKEAVKLLEQRKQKMLGTNKLSEMQYRREIKVLNLLKEQYKIQRKRELIEKSLKGLEPTIGKTSSKMLKHALTGKGTGTFDKQVSALSKKMPKFAKMFAIAGRVMGGALGLVIGAFRGSSIVILKSVKTMLDSMNKIFDQGIEGILNSVVDMAEKLGNVFSKTLGGIIGSLGGLIIRKIMLELELYVTKAQTGATGAFRTGGGTATGENVYQNFLDMTNVPSLAKEWSEEFTKLGHVGTKALQKSIFDTAWMFQQSSGQAINDLNRLLISSGNNFDSLGKDYKKMTFNVRKWAQGMKISGEDARDAFLDTAVATRYLNTDLTSVEGTINILGANTEALSQAGISLRKDLGSLVQGIQNIPGAWNYAQHAIIGMQKYGAETVPEGYVRSRFNLKGEKQGITYGGDGTFGFNKHVSKKERAVLEQGGTSDKGWDTRIEGMREHLAKVLAKEGIDPKSEEALIKGQEFYKKVYGVNNEQLRVALLFSKKMSNENKSLLKYSGKSGNVLLQHMAGNSDRLYSVAQRNSQIQMAMLKMIPMVIALLRLLPAKLASFLPGAKYWSDELDAGSKAFDTILDKFRKEAKVGSPYIRKFTEEFFKGWDMAGSAVDEQYAKDPKKRNAHIERLQNRVIIAGTKAQNIKDKSSPEYKEANKEFIKLLNILKEFRGRSSNSGKILKKHDGGMAKAGDWYKLQVGEAVSDEFFFMSPNKSVDVKSKANVSNELAAAGAESVATSKSGDTTYINIVVPSADPDIVASALRQHMAKIS